jgi:hypothetical protein
MHNPRILEIKDNIFDPRLQTQYFIMLDHLLRTREVINIEPLYFHGSPLGKLYTDDAAKLYIVVKSSWFQNDELAQMQVIYKDEDDNSFLFIAQSIFAVGVADRYVLDMGKSDYILKFYASTLEVVFTTWIGYEITLKI